MELSLALPGPSGHSKQPVRVARTGAGANGVVAEIAGSNPAPMGPRRGRGQCAASNASWMALEIRPREETSYPADLAHSRIA